MPAKKPKSPKVKPKKAALRPETVPAEPGVSNAMSLIWLPRKIGGTTVTEQTALTCASVWACVRVISEGLAKLPWRTFRHLGEDDRTPAPEHPSDWMLQTQANPETPAFQFRETIVAHALTWGNGYAEIERTLTGRPVWMWQITPDRVCVDRDSRGRVYYDIANHNQPNTTLEPQDVFHLKGLGFDGLVGYSVIAMHAKTIAAALSAEAAQANIWENDTTPGGVLEIPSRLSDAARDNVRKTWTTRHGGANNRRKLAILEEGLKWVATSLPPEDAQLLQARQYTPLEVCRIFRVQPHKIAELTRATFSNIEEQNREHVEDTLMPWAVRCEQEANLKLIVSRDQRTVYTKYNFRALLRGNAQQQSENFASKMHALGVFSANDILRLEEQNGIGSDGDKRFVPVNMQLLEKAGEVPPPSQQKPIPAAPTDQSNANMSVARDLLSDAVARALRRELHRLEDASKRFAGNLSRMNEWHTEFCNEHDAYMRRELDKPCVAAGRLLGASANGLPDVFADAYRSDAGQRASRCFEGKNGFDVDQLAGSYADSLLSMLKGSGDGVTK